jgi:hypothetical protein
MIKSHVDTARVAQVPPHPHYGARQTGLAEAVKTIIRGIVVYD